MLTNWNMANSMIRAVAENLENTNCVSAKKKYTLEKNTRQIKYQSKMIFQYNNYFYLVKFSI